MFFTSFFISAAKVGLFGGLGNRKLYIYIEYCIKNSVSGRVCTILHDYDNISIPFGFGISSGYDIFAE